MHVYMHVCIYRIYRLLKYAHSYTCIAYIC